MSNYSAGYTQSLASGGSALLDAINKGKVHLARFVLDASEHNVVNTRDIKGKTALMRVCYVKEEKTRCKAIELLIERGSDVNIQDDKGRTALSYAAELRCNDMIRLLVKNNVDPDLADDIGMTPLMYSAMIGNDTGTEILIKSFRRLGLNVDRENHDGLTALHIAAKEGHVECATILAQEGRACVSLRDGQHGRTAEEWARLQGCTTMEIQPFSIAGVAKYRQELAMKMNARPIDTEHIPQLRNTYDTNARKPKKNNISVEDLTQRLYNSGMMAGGNNPVNKQLSSLSHSRMNDKRGSLPSLELHGRQFKSSERLYKSQDNAPNSGHQNGQSPSPSLISPRLIFPETGNGHLQKRHLNTIAKGSNHLSPRESEGAITKDLTSTSTTMTELMEEDWERLDGFRENDNIDSVSVTSQKLLPGRVRHLSPDGKSGTTPNSAVTSFSSVQSTSKIMFEVDEDLSRYKTFSIGRDIYDSDEENMLLPQLG
ncbi:unnamed protein product [Owenia fusiformis]|uniref:Uncharacterized protein n=1 Tax=Owenia fusiformis TaxID=6347 RepID=A0A8J1XWZ1_OWEFU|nr:unnamed protein product [Owenia fusiformis]